MFESTEPLSQFGYEHWSGKPVTPGIHERINVPRPITDSWTSYCSCGNWRANANFYEFPEKADLAAALREAFERHVALAPHPQQE